MFRGSTRVRRGGKCLWRDLNSHSKRTLAGLLQVREKSTFSSEVTIKGWIPMKGVSMEYTHWREPYNCQL